MHTAPPSWRAATKRAPWACRLAVTVKLPLPTTPKTTSAPARVRQRATTSTTCMRRATLPILVAEARRVAERLVDRGQDVVAELVIGRPRFLGALLGPRRADDRAGHVVVTQRPGERELREGHPRLVGDRGQALHRLEHVV